MVVKMVFDLRNRFGLNNSISCMVDSISCFQHLDQMNLMFLKMVLSRGAEMGELIHILFKKLHFLFSINAFDSLGANKHRVLK